MAPDVIVANVAVPTVAPHVHAEFDGVTVTDAEPPTLVAEADVGEIEYVHVPAAWVMLNVRPAMASVPVRGLGAEFAETV